MQVYKLVKGKEGAREFARLGQWDSLEQFCEEVGLLPDSKEIAETWWVNEDPEEITVEKPFEVFETEIQSGMTSGLNGRLCLYAIMAHVENETTAWITSEEFFKLI